MVSKSENKQKFLVSTVLFLTSAATDTSKYGLFHFENSQEAQIDTEH